MDDAEAGALKSMIWTIQNPAAGALAGELGAPLLFGDASHGPRCLVGPARLNPAMKDRAADQPVLTFDSDAALLVLDAPTLGGVFEAADLIRSVDQTSATLVAEDCATLADAVALIEREVARTWPSFALRGIDWGAVCAEHAPRVLEAAEPLPALQRWLAALGDGHTLVAPSTPVTFSPCQTIAVGGALLLRDVPEDSSAWRAGARPGFRVLGVDEADWLSRTAATPQCRPLAVGRRALATTPGIERELEAEGPDGRRVRWTECPSRPPWPELVSARRLPSGAGYLRIRQWVDRPGVTEAIDEALDRFRDAPGLVVDLRSNSGGNGRMAFGFRDRFLRAGGVIGHVRYSDPSTPGALTAPEPIVAEPAPPERRWSGPVRFLTDGLSYSASEDSMLGLAGLPHVQVIGEPSGGGSGRARSLRLLPGWRLMISTALAYTLGGWCVEGAGIPVDRFVPVRRPHPAGVDRVLAVADEGW